jgi:hypothetical protein
MMHTPLDFTFALLDWLYYFLEAWHSSPPTISGRMENLVLKNSKIFVRNTTTWDSALMYAELLRNSYCLIFLVFNIAGRPFGTIFTQV